MDFRKRFMVKPGAKVDLGKVDPDFTGKFTKEEAKERTKRNWERLSEMQELVYSTKKLAFLFTFTARDAGGKDGSIKGLAGALNPQGINVVSFKVPTEEELAHDFLWRIHKNAPAKGHITFFNRSHMEDVLIVRVKKLAPEDVIKKRFGHINNWEELLDDSGTSVTKFYLHISEEERLKRFTQRRDDPAKRWKRSNADFTENTGSIVDEYNAATEDALSKCSTGRAPFYVIPANKKWFRDLAISEIAVAVMEERLKAAGIKPPPPAAKIDPVLEKAYFAQFDKKGAKAKTPAPS